MASNIASCKGSSFSSFHGDDHEQNKHYALNSSVSAYVMHGLIPFRPLTETCSPLLYCTVLLCCNLIEPLALAPSDGNAIACSILVRYQLLLCIHRRLVWLRIGTARKPGCYSGSSKQEKVNHKPYRSNRELSSTLPSMHSLRQAMRILSHGYASLRSSPACNLLQRHKTSAIVLVLGRSEDAEGNKWRRAAPGQSLALRMSNREHTINCRQGHFPGNMVAVRL